LENFAVRLSSPFLVHLPMSEDIAKNLCHLKQEFVKAYKGNSHIQEIIPLTKSEAFPIDEKHLELLHEFAKKNPIYYNCLQKKILFTIIHTNKLLTKVLAWYMKET
jgi:hypothetical protein